MDINWDELKNKFIVDSWDPARIAAHYQVKRMEISQVMARDGWRLQREEYIKKMVGSTQETVGLEGHIQAADHLVAVGKNLAKDLNDPEADHKVMRSRAETYRTTVEALNISIRLSRDVRGIRLGQPSAEDAENRDVAVVYTTRIQREGPPPEKEVVNG